MFSPVLSPDPLSICVLALGGTIFGLLDLLCGPRLHSRGWVLPGAFGTVVLAAGLATRSFHLLTEATSLALLVLAGLCGLLSLLRSDAVRWASRLLLRLISSRGLQSLFVLLFSVTLALGWAVQGDVRDLFLTGFEDETPFVRLNPSLEQAPGQVQTDRGRVIRLYTVSATFHATDAEMTQAERQMVRDKGELLQVIRTAEADWHSNCHGWVFTGGHYWINPEDVRVILQDNGYYPVSDPVAGDLAVTEDDDGHVLHTGVVRSSSPGPLLIESKWGYLGRFLHGPHQNPYGSFTYYRSSRSGHLLHGLLSDAIPQHTS